MDTGTRQGAEWECEASPRASAQLPRTLLTSGHPESLFYLGHIPTLPQGRTVPLVSNSVSTHELPVLLTTVTRPLPICVFRCVPGEIMVSVGIAVGRQATGL